ncbi:MAG: transglutaminase family protein [Rhizobiales bacterium]|nr:transglutaminase family protein [Hyphomicrobiales bacterium]
MQIRIGFDIKYWCGQPTPTLFKLLVEPTRQKDLITPEHVDGGDGLLLEEYRDSFGNRCQRGLSPAGMTHIRLDAVLDDDGSHDEQNLSARETPVFDLPPDVLRFVQPSRYCESDLLSNFAWSQFGSAPPGWERVQAIVDFTHRQIAFGYQYADVFRTATGALNQRVGVCRDYAHLAVALCRAMNIPARYCNGYMGDIGVPADPAPMDFNAWFEVYLDGKWYTFDARHNRPRIGRIVICRGLDAADCAMIQTFGPHTLNAFKVVTEQVSCGAPVALVA